LFAALLAVDDGYRGDQLRKPERSNSSRSLAPSSSLVLFTLSPRTFPYPFRIPTCYDSLR